MAKLVSIFLLLAGLTACNQRQSNDYIILVDTSGSMQKDGQITKVKNSIKKILLNYAPGDHVFLFTFDLYAQLHSKYLLNSNQDMDQLFTALDKIEAKGDWTNLVGALDTSLSTAVSFKRKNPDRNITLILYTDGIHDLPATDSSAEKLDFSDIFQKYFKGYDPKRPDWYMYYVKLDKVSPKLKEFITQTGSGQVIGDDMLEEDVNFFNVLKRKKVAKFAKILGVTTGALLLCFVILSLFRPWFKDGMEFSYSSGGSSTQSKSRLVNLGRFSKPIFTNKITVGTKGEIAIAGAGIKGRHFAIGVTFKNRIFIQPLEGGQIKVDGRPISTKTVIKFDQQMKVGTATFKIINKSA